jgi:hypothetical protein
MWRDKIQHEFGTELLYIFNERKVRNRVREQSRKRERKEEETDGLERERERMKKRRRDLSSLFNSLPYSKVCAGRENPRESPFSRTFQ